MKLFLGQGLGYLSLFGCALLLFSSSTLLGLSFEKISLFGHEILAGGTLGKISAYSSQRYLNLGGSYILFSFFFLLSLSFTLNLSFTSLLRRIWGKKKLKRRTLPKPQEDTSFPPGPSTVTGGYQLPDLSLLDLPNQKDSRRDKEVLVANARMLEASLKNSGIEGKVIEINPGPVITSYGFEPAPGIRINRIVTLADDLALALKALSVRILAPIPGKSVVGIEIPNSTRETVSFREIVAQEAFQRSPSLLTLALGKDISGNLVIADLAKMPHLLVAGATGSGKSISINCTILSILFKARPREVKFLMIDPKRLELSFYEEIPHLLIPVVVEAKMAAEALKGAVFEMERRYELLSREGVRDIEGFNQKASEKLSYIVVVIDELADLMMVSSREVEDSISRLAHMARAAGIHLIVATQRPSVDVLTGVIKANFSARISFQVSSKVDSRTILDTTGAERLLGLGDMLFLSPYTSRTQRIHGTYVSEKEVMRVVNFLREQAKPSYDEEFLKPKGEVSSEMDSDYDEKYDEAITLVRETKQASISMLQRRLRVGYNRAARMIEKMEKEGIVGSSDGVKPRDVLIR